MLDDKFRAELDQKRAALVELMPVLWRELYLENIKLGFNDNESFELVKIYILSQGENGIQP